MNSGRTRPMRTRLFSSALIAVLVAGCTTWKLARQGLETVVPAEKPEVVRITLADDARLDIHSPRIDGDSLRGTRTGILQDQRVAVALADVRSVEVRRVDVARIAWAVGGITALIVVAADVRPTTTRPRRNPQPFCETCVSCPLVYSWDGMGWRLDSGTFGGAILPALARTDTDNLDFLRPDPNGFLRLKLTNELNETDYVDALRLLAVDHDPDLTVAPDAQGRLYTLGAPVAPTAAADFHGRDALSRVRAADGWSWESNPAGRDTARDLDVRDGLVLEFPRPAGARDARLVLDAHNSPWAAHLMSEFVRAHGERTQAWYDSMQAHPVQARELGALFARETFLGVAVWAAGRWEPQGLVWEAGPEIVKRHVLALDLSRVDGDTVRVRLESVPSFWLIDHVAVDYATPRPLRVHELRAESASDLDNEDVHERLAGIDGHFFVMETGDAAELTFLAPEIPAGMARTYLVQSSGWYRIHSPAVGEPQLQLLARLSTEPRALSRIAVARLNEALLALEVAAR